MKLVHQDKRLGKMNSVASKPSKIYVYFDYYVESTMMTVGLYCYVLFLFNTLPCRTFQRIGFDHIRQ